MKTAVGIAFAAAFATVAPLSAQEVKQTLSLDEAIAVTLTENPAMKAAEFEEKAAMQERRAAIGLRMPQINVTGAYAYLGKDIGFDFNEMKGPAKNLAGVRTERLQAAYNFDLLLAQLLETAGISDEFPAYARRSDARPVLFDKK